MKYRIHVVRRREAVVDVEAESEVDARFEALHGDKAFEIDWSEVPADTYISSVEYHTEG